MKIEIAKERGFTYEGKNSKKPEAMSLDTTKD
jgi:hypothetical protein